MVTEQMNYTVLPISANVQAGDLVYVKALDMGYHAVGEVKNVYEHGIHAMLYMAEEVDESTYQVIRKLYPEFINMNMSSSKPLA